MSKTPNNGYEPRTDDWARSFEIEEDHDDIPCNRTGAPSFEEIVRERLSRRDALKAALVAAAGASIPGWFFARSARAGEGDVPVVPSGAHSGGPSTLDFQSLTHAITESHAVSAGYTAEPLIAWGDALEAGAAPFDGSQMSEAEQRTRFGYNNDFIAYMPLPRGSDNSERGLLCVNHEYTCAWLMWPGMKNSMELSPDQVGLDIAAHGHSVVEVRKEAGTWRAIAGSRYNRRLTADGPSIRISGPAAGSDRMKTTADPTGTVVAGTINNCAGGETPWGTVLLAEENTDKYFLGDPAKTGSERRNHERMSLGKPEYDWRSHDARYDLEREPNEPNRYGWVVEFDPYDPESVPVKRTALGRFKHEGATTVINPDGRLVVYMGDDQRFEYIYKFVSARAVDTENHRNNTDLLDEGTLSVARFDADGTVRWLPLVFGEGPLTPENDFHSQADVLIETRRAADLLAATPMDRPEDVEPNPATGRVYAMLTKNDKRTAAQVDAANPRADNIAGHIIEIIPPGAEGGVRTGDDRGTGGVDHAAGIGRWEVFLRAGDPGNPDAGALYHPDVSRDGWLLCPDNCAFDNRGRLWIATDQGSLQRKSGVPDGLFATDTTGEGRALTKLFFACPTGAELCGPCFTPDNTTAFVAVQHPGDGSTYDEPSTRWPAGKDSGLPPRPAVVAITREDGGVIGG